MLHNDYGPRGAEEEHDPTELWVDLSESDPVAKPQHGHHAPMASHNDPLGSWTGTPTGPALTTGLDTENDIGLDTEEETEVEEQEIPTQDADDL